VTMTPGDEWVVELGAILDVDPFTSTAVVPAGLVGEVTKITVTALNAASVQFPFEVPVQVMISGANKETVDATWSGEGVYEARGVYEATYTPKAAGTDHVEVYVDGNRLLAGPYTSEVAPLSGDLVVIVSITGTGDAPSDGLPVELYQAGDSNPVLFMTDTTDIDGEATFTDIDFANYVVHLPKRDFDMTFQEGNPPREDPMTQPVTHDEEDETVTFYAVTESIPSLARVYRVQDGGTGNAFQYIVGGRSWNSAQNQVQSDYLLGVGGHLATIIDAQENAFVAEFFIVSPELCPYETNPNKCKYQGWIGLTDNEVEGEYKWVTNNDLVTFFAWPGWENEMGVEPEDPKENKDHVEIDLTGTWGIVNGASSTNEGYFVEYEVEWPDTPPF
jgi:hypothetical protein